jgi:hypothetical protein
MSKKQWILIAAIIGSFAMLYPFCFDSKVDPNGDNVSYFLLGKGLAHGDGFTSNYTIPVKAETHFPPGYPILIAAITTFVGPEITIIKATNGLLFLAVIMLVYFLARRFGFSELLAAVMAFSVLLSPNILRFSTIMMSELFYSFLSIAFLYMCTRIRYDIPFYKSRHFVFATILLIGSIYVRSIGMALAFGAFVYLISIRKWKHAIVMIGSAAIANLPWVIRGLGLGGSTYASQLMMVNPYDTTSGQVGAAELVQRIWDNALRYMAREIPSGIFELSVASITSPYSISEWGLGVTVVALIVLGAITLRTHRWLVVAYLSAFIGILLLWPTLWVGSRFIIPIIPVLLILGWNGVKQIVDYDWPFFRNNGFVNRPQFIAALFLLYVAAQFNNIKSLNEIASDNYISQMDSYIKAAQWVKTNTPEDAIICCRKGSLFHLFSDRRVTGYRSTKNAEWLFQDLADKGVDYLVLDEFGFSSGSKYLRPAGLKYPGKVDFLYLVSNSKTYVGAFNPDLGYSGSFQNGKRHGPGTLRWASGRCFDVVFEDGKANGQGVLTYPSGLVLKATWKNDKLHGPAELFNSNGQKVENRVYEDGTLISEPEP